MKKRLFSYIIFIAICVVVLFAGVSFSSSLCSKDRSFICSTFAFVFDVNIISTIIAPDKGYAKFYAHPDLIYRQELASSIFHPPKIAS